MNSTRPLIARGGQQRRVLMRAVVERDGPTCGRCGGWIDSALSGLHPDGPTLGHIIPASRGGSDELDNLRPEHRRCNLAASDRPVAPIALVARPIGIES
jgi:5-methylcytosine-specific restriction endonuclease McrA